jgi:hypothetical protein
MAVVNSSVRSISACLASSSDYEYVGELVKSVLTVWFSRPANMMLKRRNVKSFDNTLLSFANFTQHPSATRMIPISQESVDFRQASQYLVDTPCILDPGTD